MDDSVGGVSLPLPLVLASASAARLALLPPCRQRHIGWLLSAKIWMSRECRHPQERVIALENMGTIQPHHTMANDQEVDQLEFSDTSVHITRRLQ